MLSPEDLCEMGLGGWLGGGSDPLPIPPLFKGREENAARTESDTTPNYSCE
jgi:hypothetical protein